jgi:hypothetical protein
LGDFADKSVLLCSNVRPMGALTGRRVAEIERAG